MKVVKQNYISLRKKHIDLYDQIYEAAFAAGYNEAKETLQEDSASMEFEKGYDVGLKDGKVVGLNKGLGFCENIVNDYINNITDKKVKKHLNKLLIKLENMEEKEFDYV